MITSPVKAATISFGSTLIETDASMALDHMEVRPTVFPIICELVIEMAAAESQDRLRSLERSPTFLASFRVSCETRIRRE